MIYYDKTAKTTVQPNFNISEFRCRCSDPSCDCTWHDPKLSEYLQTIRNHFGQAVHITSGYRCQTHNAAVGGATKSRHTRGEAADFYISGVSPADIAAYCESIGILGIGCYDKEHGNFVHIDTRQQKYFWVNKSANAVSTFGGQTTEGEHVPKAALYAVTCRNADGEAVTYLFDHSIGNYRQGVLTMNPGDTTAFTAQAGTEILQITGM